MYTHNAHTGSSFKMSTILVLTYSMLSANAAYDKVLHWNTTYLHWVTLTSVMQTAHAHT